MEIHYLIFLLVLISSSFFRSGVHGQGCEIDPFGGAVPSPLLTNANNEFIYPADSRETTLKFAVGETVTLACPGGSIVLSGTQSTLSLASATCVTGARFRINNANWLWRQIQCSTDPVSTSRYTGQTCELNGKMIEIGFQLAPNRFARSILVCFNPANQSTLYVHYELVPSVANSIKGTPRPGWSQGTNIFNISTVNTYYLRNTQRKTINSLLGLSSSSIQYIQNNNYFLSRGHLVARSDYFYAALQNATFYFENALPQWQTFNAFNWEQSENDVQTYASVHNVKLQVWTGGYGVTTLPHASTGIETPLYLYTNGGARLIPVPDMFWKVVYNPETRRGVALIGVNNPYKGKERVNMFCDDRSSLVTWLNWRKDDQARGYSFACTVTAFRRVVHWMPNIDVRGLLF